MSFHPHPHDKTWPGGVSVADTRSARDIGVSVGERTRELFVSEPVDAALSAHIELSGLRYMALGDLGGGLARRCLIDTARASGWPIQRLIVRRQGLGETVATVLFLDSPAQDGQMVRVVCADVDTDDVSRRALFLLWMTHSELAALMVPEQDVALQAQAIDALREQVAQAQPAWRSRKLIFMPKQTSPDLIQHIAAFQQATGIESRLAPAVRRADRAWVFLGSAWNQLQDSAPLAAPCA